MATRLFLTIIILAIAFGIGFAFASPLNMPLDHWSYHFIERLQAKGVLGNFLSSSKPYSRDEVADMVSHISTLMEDGAARLSKVEKDQLEILKRELASEMAERGLSSKPEYRHLVDWSDSENRIVTEVALSQSAAIKRGTEDYHAIHSGFQVYFWGKLRNELFFYSDTWAGYKETAEPLPLWRPYMYRELYGWDSGSNTYLILRLPWADIQMGKDTVLWGPGYHGTIGLSGVDPAFDVVRMPIQLWKIKFTSILGFLRDDLAKEYENDIVRKYLSAHRIEIKPFTGVCIGAQEVYIYSEDLHIELINPLMPYQMAEDYLGDVGNNTIEADIDISLIPNTRLYLSLFLDDFHPDRSIFTYIANRWAILGGLLVTDPFGLENSDFRIEYARIEPWVYPHKGIIETPPVPLSYKHFDTPLGHWIGPNSDDLFFEANYRFSKDLSTKLSYSRIRKGEIGGSLYDYDAKIIHAATEELGMAKHFLMGIVEKTQTFELGLEYNLSHNTSIRLDYSHARIHNKQAEEAKLPSSDVRKQPWETGRNWMQNIVEASVNFRY